MAVRLDALNVAEPRDAALVAELRMIDARMQGLEDRLEALESFDSRAPELEVARGDVRNARRQLRRWRNSLEDYLETIWRARQPQVTKPSKISAA